MASTEYTLDIPAALCTRKRGFSFDYGGSMIKVAYATDEGENVRLHFLSFPSEEREKALTFIRETCGEYLESVEESFVCGLGGNLYAEEIKQHLAARIKNTNELECMIDAFLFLAKHTPFEDMVLPEDEKAVNSVLHFSKRMIDMQTAWLGERNRHIPWELTSDTQQVLRRAKNVEYPVMLVLCGSASMTFAVEEDGTYKTVEFTPTSGRCIAGLSSLLTGCKNFEEISALAENGVMNNVDQTAKSMAIGGDEDVYSSMKDIDEMPSFKFGHAVWKTPDDFRKEDLAIATMDLVAEHIAVMAHHACLATNIPQVYFVGGLTGRDKTFRRVLNGIMQHKVELNMKGKRYDFMFVKLGTYLGALGALLSYLGCIQTNK